MVMLIQTPVSWSGTCEFCTLKTVQISTKQRKDELELLFKKKKLYIFQWQSHGGFVRFFNIGKYFNIYRLILKQSHIT